MNKYKIIWSPKSYTDLQNIYNYITFYLKEPLTAKKLVQKILNSTSKLSYFPEKHMKLKEYSDISKNIRRLPVNKYIIIYEVDNNTRASLHLTYFSL